MGDGVSHLVGRRQRQLRMRCSELGGVLLDVVAGLANDLQVADHGVLYQRVVQERHFVHMPGVAPDALDGFEDVGQIVGQPLLIAGHIGSASASTFARKLSGNASGVSTSTGTPSSLPSS